VATKAYVLINTAVGKSTSVLRSLQQVKGIREADAVTGEVDIIAIVEAEDLNGIGNVVTTNIHRVEGVQRTKTYVRAMDN
jgi:DNA-binding Lrp family transcriptional regulator